jgi:hypothetical protein
MDRAKMITDIPRHSADWLLGWSQQWTLKK